MVIGEVLTRYAGKTCALCGRSESLVIDHDHSSGDLVDIRGVLCSGCNTAIGVLGDTEDIIRARAERILEYLK